MSYEPRNLPDPMLRDFRVLVLVVATVCAGILAFAIVAWGEPAPCGRAPFVKLYPLNAPPVLPGGSASYEVCVHNADNACVCEPDLFDLSFAIAIGREYGIEEAIVTDDHSYTQTIAPGETRCFSLMAWSSFDTPSGTYLAWAGAFRRPNFLHYDAEIGTFTVEAPPLLWWRR